MPGEAGNPALVEDSSDENDSEEPSRFQAELRDYDDDSAMEGERFFKDSYGESGDDLEDLSEETIVRSVKYSVCLLCGECDIGDGEEGR